MDEKIKADKIIWLLLLILSIFLVIFPIYIMFKYSISDRRSWITGGEYPVPWWPFKPTFEMYRYYLGDKRFWGNGWLSLKIALLTVTFSLVLGTPAAYSLARFKFNGKAVLLFLILAIRFYPDISSVIPVSYIFNKSFSITFLMK
ncbi:hypothetical protein [Caloramator sp. Dgby_cultured_2]|uniref:hypothetical protein n=1 Tax=Caloramator sp. Dgby_cultured_2 TaxID=3029174 RepID=UPI00237EAC30|nr:hypothetical protein [Caloramator sp. Dgby_cultured_2]WDU82453.1 hypothetical protein PWK10_12530 [Caloramator sp. Dgby_cultured_2]